MTRAAKSNRARRPTREKRAAASPAAPGETLAGGGWRGLVGPAAVLAAAALMLAWTWRTWADPFVDNGQQVYIPWRLAEGETLYRDIAFYNGPFSQYFTALAFRIGGTSLTTYFTANLLVLGLFLAVAYHALERTASGTSATLGCVVFVVMFAFGQFGTVSGYNWVAPYASEGTHGLLLGLASLAAAWRYPAGGRRWVVLSGLLVGTALLTKAEIALAAVVAVPVAFALTFATTRATWGEVARSAGLFLAACAAPWALAVGLLSLRMPLSAAALGSLGSWRLLFNPDVNTLTFHRLNMGILQPWAQLRAIGVASACYLAFLAPAALIALSLRRPGIRNAFVYILLFLGAGAAAFFAVPQLAWLKVGLPFSAAMLVFAAAHFALWLKAPGDEADRLLHVRRLTLSLFALGALAKILLNGRIHHYGFLHAAPAAMVLTAALWDWLSAAVRRFGGDVYAFRSAALGPVVVCVAFHLLLESAGLKQLSVPVAVGADRFYSDARGRYLNAALETLSQAMAPGQTLAALPASCMLNYLARRPTPIPYTQITPTELAAYGEAAVLGALEKRPPDWIALVHFDAIEFGQRFFGVDYGRETERWIRERYQPEVRIGAAPFTGEEFGLVILSRTPKPAGPQP
jgi:hypothetical protein